MKTITHAVPPSRHDQPLFKSFFQGSFACSTACRGEGKRVDMVINSGHDMLLKKDYAQLADHQLLTARDCARWYLIEKTPGEYDWSTFLPVLHAAENNSLEIIWELAHFGWPDHLDIWQSEFVDSFADFARAIACLMRDEGHQTPFFTPVNQISFWAWAGAEIALFNPGVTGRGHALKQQLVRASIAAMHAIREELPGARFVLTDPLVHIAASEKSPTALDAASHQHIAQYDGWDMLSGRLSPELGGDETLLDIIGVNYYPDNQWYLNGDPLMPGQAEYRPLSSLLLEVWQRYQRPLLIAETGAEGDMRAPWLRSVVEEVNLAREQGADVEGVSIYPVVDYPSWADDRRSPDGLFGLPDANGNRTLCEPYALEIRSQHIRNRNVAE